MSNDLLRYFITGFIGPFRYHSLRRYELSDCWRKISTVDSGKQEELPVFFGGLTPTHVQNLTLVDYLMTDRGSESSITLVPGIEVL